MNECKKCGFWDSDCEGCTCPSTDKWYACPVESENPENKNALKEWAEQKEEIMRVKSTKIKTESEDKR